MPTPSTRTPVRIARGSYSNLNGSLSDLQDGEIIYAEDQNKLYIKESSSLVLLTSTFSSPTFTGDVTFTGTANNVVFDASDNALEFADSAKATFGSSTDLSIYHDASNSYIKEAGTGQLHIQADNLILENAAGANYLVGISGGEVILYHNDSNRITTTAAGVEIGGNLSTASGNSFTINAGGASGTAGSFIARCGSENAIVGNPNGSIDLYHDNVLTFKTEPNGVKILGSEGNYAYLHLWEDEGDDNADKWRMEVAGGSFKLANYSTGSWANGLTLDGSNNAVFYGNITLNNSYPSISWTDSNHNSDYRITNNDGTLVVYDVTNSLHILDFQADGDIKLPVDNKKLIFGAGDNLKLSSNGSKGIVEGSLSQVATAVSALDLNLNTSNYFTKTISGNSTFTFSNPAPSGTATAFTLELTHSSGTVTWPSSVKWNADTAPTLTAGKTHLFMFVTDDGGSRYRGSALVDYVN